MTRPVLHSNVVHLHRTVVLPVRTLDELAREGEGVDLYDCLAMPPVEARAATPSGLSRFASSCKHRITIAIGAHGSPSVATSPTGEAGAPNLSTVLCIAIALATALYFIGQLVRWAL